MLHYFHPAELAQQVDRIQRIIFEGFDPRW